MPRATVSALTPVAVVAAVLAAVLAVALPAGPASATDRAGPGQQAAGRRAGSPVVVSVHAVSRPVDTAPVRAGLVGGDWEGFGVNWNAVPNGPGPGTGVVRGNPARWHVLSWGRDGTQLVADEQRLLALRPAYVRMSWSINWFSPTYRVGDYRWHATVMQDRYLVLSFLQEHDIPVITGMWLPPRHTIQYGSQRWTALSTALVAHLVDKLHFTNIKYWINGNEPSSYGCPATNCGISFNAWESAIGRLHSSMARAGLLAQVQLMGPTMSGAYPWDVWDGAGKQVDNWPATLARSPSIRDLGAVDWHQYLVVNGNEAPTGAKALRAIKQVHAERATQRIVNAVHQQPHAAGVKTFVSEFGFQGIDRSKDNGVPSYPFALAMLKYGMDVARSGVNGASIWELDPDVPDDRIAGDGLVRSSGRYPAYVWYQAMQMLFKAVPPGSVIEPLEQPPGHHDLDLTVAKVPQGHGTGWSVLALNTSSNDRWISFRGLTGVTSLSQYDLTQGHQQPPSATQLVPDYAVPVRDGVVTTDVPAGGTVLLAA